MRFDVFTLFPEVFHDYLETIILQRARQRGFVEIGDGVARAGGLLLDGVRKTVKEIVPMFSTDQTEIVQAVLGANAGVLGVAL